MKKYDEILKVQSLNEYTISVINSIQMAHPEKKYLVQIPNTRHSTSQGVARLVDGVFVRVAGSYDKERLALRKGYLYADGETGRYYYDAVIYSKPEIYHITRTLEKIEEGMRGLNLSDFEKVVYLYGKLKNYVMYDPYFEIRGSRDVRSLRGLVSRKSVCAGFAVMFKELMDRQGIDCKYVEGLANGDVNGAHAWNIVTVNGMNIPIDVTWDNSNYRSGKSDTYEFLGNNVAKFMRSHVPYQEEPTRKMRLSEIDPELVKKVAERFSIQNEYIDNLYLRQRNDGSWFVLAQVGDEEIDEKTYYRYYYADVERGEKAGKGEIFYGETNINEIIDSLNFGLNTDISRELNHMIDNVLFSKENLNDSRAKNTQFIGSGVAVNEMGSFLIQDYHEIAKAATQTFQFRYPVKQYQREDGSTFVIQKMENRDAISEIPIFTYQVFEMVKEGDHVSLKRNEIYSEEDFFEEHNPEIANSFLSRKRIDRKMRQTGGYVGCYIGENVRTQDPTLAEFFKNRNIGGTRADEVVETKNVETATNEEILHKGKRRDFANRLIQYYDTIENQRLYSLRCELENANLSTVVCSIEGNKSKTLAFDDKNIHLDEASLRTETKVILSTVRLLKAAESLSLSGGKDYLEELLAIPEIDNLLSFIGKSRGLQELKTRANEREMNQTEKSTLLTPAEQDKELAEAYLSGEHKSQVSPKSEIDYRRTLYHNSHGLVLISKKPQPFIKEYERARASLDKIIARQEGKRIGSMMYGSGLGWYYETKDDPQFEKYVKQRTVVQGGRDLNKGTGITMKNIQKLSKPYQRDDGRDVR